MHCMGTCIIPHQCNSYGRILLLTVIFILTLTALHSYSCLSNPVWSTNVGNSSNWDCGQFLPLNSLFLASVQSRAYSLGQNHPLLGLKSRRVMPSINLRKISSDYTSLSWMRHWLYLRRPLSAALCPQMPSSLQSAINCYAQTMSCPGHFGPDTIIIIHAIQCRGLHFLPGFVYLLILYAHNYSQWT